MSEHSHSAAPAGLYEQPRTELDISLAEWIAVALTVIWLSICALFFFVLEDGSNFDSLRIVIEVLAVFLPVGMMWVGATAARSARIIREESRRLGLAIDGIRHTYMASQQGSVRPGGSISPELVKKLEALVSDQQAKDSALAMFTSSRRLDAIKSMPLPKANKDEEAQPSLALGTPAEDMQPPLSNADFIRALHFPDTAEDQDGFAALRRGLKSRHAAMLIRASQDILTLLSQDGIYMDDLTPDRARPEIWRRFAEGERGGTVAALGGIRDKSCLALATGRMRQDPVFRDAALHFLRQFDKTFAGFAAEASDEEISLFSDTRTARAFMLIARISGTFD